MNKRGAEKIISVYWFLMLIIVAGGIYAMVYTFYGHPFDVREVEASILINNIADCISEKGAIKGGVFNQTSGLVSNDFDDNFLEKCKIDFNVEDEHNWDKDKQYYFRIDFYTLDNQVRSFSNISKGNKKWKEDCDINNKKIFGILSKCVKKRFYSVDGSKQILIGITSIVRKTEKNVKQ